MLDPQGPGVDSSVLSDPFNVVISFNEKKTRYLNTKEIPKEIPLMKPVEPHHSDKL